MGINGVDIPTSDQEVLEKTGSLEISPKNIFAKEQKGLSLMGDEFAPLDVLDLKPLKQVTVIKVKDGYGGSRPPKKEQVDITGDLEEEFDYLSKTKGLETNTIRTKVLQELVMDKLTEGAGIQTRVIIINKGGVEAFVMPDGSVFISQALLNKLDNLDEVAAVLAHEVGHLIFRTSLKKIEKGDSGLKRFGMGWIHEAASDSKAPELLEKAGFNSLAFASAIEKISGSERGTVHQSGLSRASQSVGQHLAIDRETSSVISTQIPPILKGEVKKTNLEIIREIINKEPKTTTEKASEQVTGHWSKEIKTALELLHSRDLGELYNSSLREARWWNKEDKNAKFLNLCESLISKRLQQYGYSRADSILFLMYNLPSAYNFEDKFINSVDDFSQTAEVAESFESVSKFKEMHKLVFNNISSSSRLNEHISPTETYLDSLTRYLYDINVENPPRGIPVTKEALLDALEKLSKIKILTLGFYEGDSKPLSKVINSYINRTYLLLAADANDTVDINQLKDFFEEIKGRGINLDPKIFIHTIKNDHTENYFGKDLNISPENQAIVMQAYSEVFGVQTKEKNFSFKEIDDFFQEFQTVSGESEKAERMKVFVKELREFFDQNKFNGQQRLYHLQYIAQKIDSAPVKDIEEMYPISYSHYLENNEITEVREENRALETVFNGQVVNFYLKTILALSLFEQDSSEFYSFLNQTMTDSGIDINNLSKIQLINLCQSIFTVEDESAQAYWYGKEDIKKMSLDKCITFTDYDSLLSLPFLKQILKPDQELGLSNIKDLNHDLKNRLHKYSNVLEPQKEFYGNVKQVAEFDLFQESLVGFLIGKGARDNFYQLLESGIKEEEYGQFYEFIEHYYPDGPQKTQFQREINKLYLNSPRVSIEEKTEYLIRFFDQVGPEGMLIVANGITDIYTYSKFREKIGTKLNDYLEGASIISATASVDFLTSSFVKNFDQLLQTTTTDPKAKVKVSTDMAKNWFDGFFATGYLKPVETYDKENNKFFLSKTGRSFFRTFNDMAKTLTQTSSIQRFAAVHKALVDTNGALTNPKSRKILGERLVKSLGLGKDFISSVLMAACQEADAKLIAFPAASMLGPLLFRAIDINSVDLKSVGKVGLYLPTGYSRLDSELSNDQIFNILRSDTRSITKFGFKYQKNPFTQQFAEDSDLKYQQTTDSLNALFSESQANKPESETKINLNPAIEAVIKGVETSGALGIRALQLAAQFYSFSSALENRLAETFDSNAGLNKLLFWENLQKLGEGDEKIKDFLGKITLRGYLGGGSLQTTYAATYIDEGGKEKQIILKMKNPNVEAFIREGYQSAHRSLEVVSKQRFAGKNREYAKTGMVLMDLSQKWCLDDINDKTFVEDDDLFRQTIIKFNLETGVNQFYAPERLFTSSKLKSEDLAQGDTVNRLLNDETVPIEIKKKVVGMLAKFFKYQFRGNSFTNETGKKYFLVHSDPHVGNYIADISGENPKIGVIDRSFYLKLEEADVKTLEKLVVGGNTTEFADSFINRILDINKVRGIQRAVVRNVVFGKLTLESAQQMARGGINRFGLMRTMLTELSNAKMDVPINLRLMVRNIGAFQGLAKKYGFSLEDI